MSNLTTRRKPDCINIECDCELGSLTAYLLADELRILEQIEGKVPRRVFVRPVKNQGLF
jgi:hypothetical protein